jgi:hypothetical protein
MTINSYEITNTYTPQILIPTLPTSQYYQDVFQTRNQLHSPELRSVTTSITISNSSLLHPISRSSSELPSA